MTTSGSTVGQSNQSFPVSEPSTEPDQVQVLVSAHLNLLGERLKEISRNITSVSTFCTLNRNHSPLLKVPWKGSIAKYWQKFGYYSWYSHLFINSIIESIRSYQRNKSIKKSKMERKLTQEVGWFLKIEIHLRKSHSTSGIKLTNFQRIRKKSYNPHL